MENVATYSEARSEYTKQLATFIVPTLVGWFQQLWSRNANDKLRCLALFQTECEEIARWNIDRVQDEVRVLIERTGCDYMEELMTAVFIAHTKILTAVRMSTKQKKLSIHIPKLDQFIHRIFKEAARGFWKSPFLFMDTGSVVDRQKNILQIEAIATEAITTAVRSLLPVKQILRDYLEGDQEDVEEEEKPETVPTEAELGAMIDPVPVPASAPEEKKIEEAAVVEKKEETPVAPATVDAQKVEEAPPMTDVSSNATAEPPAVIKIDTEPAVRFSAYDDVYDEARGEPELRHTPKDTDSDLDMEDLPSDGTLIVNEETTTGITELDAEDIEAPMRTSAAEKVIRDTIDDADVEVLE